MHELRLLILCAGDPDGERPFSGSARSLFQALERRGCVHHKANVYGWTDPFARGNLLVRSMRRLDRAGLEERYRWTARAFARNTRRAARAAAQHPGFNACLLYGTNFLPPPGVPAYCYLDATAAQVRAARAWEFARLSARRARWVTDYQRGVFERCACVFPRTRWAAESVRRDYGIADARIVVAGAGTNQRAEPLPHGPYDRRIVLFVGTEFERKGGPVLVEAFRRVRAAMPDATLRIVGCAPEVREPGVEVIGRVARDTAGGAGRLREIYGEASVFCIMSRFEPFGIVVVEAQDAGVPCVLPARFAFPEMIRDGVTGRLVGEDRPEALAAALLDMLGDPARLEAMGCAGRAFVREQFTWDEAAARMHARMAADLAAARD